MIVQVSKIENKIDFIKAIRLGLGYGLKDSKTLAEQLIEGPVIISHAQMRAINWAMGDVFADAFKRTVGLGRAFNNERLTEVDRTTLPDWHNKTE